MAEQQSPAFQEAERCDVCNCSFNAFRRRHHCRCCGRTLCHEHSANQMALPQYGIYSSVRVCSDCFNNSSRSKPWKDEAPSSSDALSPATESIARLDIGVGINDKAESASGNPTLAVPECKCGMPLCICEAPAPDPAPLQVKKVAASVIQSNPRPKKAVGAQEIAEPVSRSIPSSSTKPSVFFNLGQAGSSGVGKDGVGYEVTGEGLREAIKSGDAFAVKKLLNEGVDPNYCDNKGLTLLHLAALFNQTEITFILMDHGASLECKNAQGETPLDCAPAMLQYKMRKKMEESA